MDPIPRFLEPPTLCLALLVLVLPARTAAGDGAPTKEQRSVGVIEGKVYPTPDRTQPPVSRLPYASRVELLDSAGPPDLLQPWHRIRETGVDDGDCDGDGGDTTEAAGPVEGWMLDSILDSRPLLARGEKDRRSFRARRQEQTLAGRSFEDEVEQRLKRRKPELGRALEAIDQALADIPPGELETLHTFRREGQLRPLEDARPDAETAETSAAGEGEGRP